MTAAALLILATGLLLGILIGSGPETPGLKYRRNTRRRRGDRWQRKGPAAASRAAPDTAPPAYADAAEQLRIVMAAQFSRQPLLNKSEARLFDELDRLVAERNPGWQVMAQVSMGEILRSRDADAYRCINSKRIDLLLVDESRYPRLAVEYQGGGHYQGNAAARDAIKKEALRRAGVGYHEVVAGQTTPSELRRLVEKLVDEPVPA